MQLPVTRKADLKTSAGSESSAGGGALYLSNPLSARRDTVPLRNVGWRYSADRDPKTLILIDETVVEATRESLVIRLLAHQPLELRLISRLATKSNLI